MAGLARRDRGVGMIGRLMWAVVGVDVSTRIVVEVSESPIGTVGGQVGGEVGLKKAASVF